MPEPTTFRWDRLTVTCVLSFCLLVGGLSVGVVLGELRDELRLSGVMAAAHGSTFGLGLLVMGLFGLRIVAPLGRTRTFWLTCTCIVLGVVLLCLGRSWPITLAGTALAGLACAMLVMLMPGIVADHHGAAWVSAFAAVNGLPGMAGIAYSVAVGAAITAGLSWRGPYLGLTVVVAAVLVAVGARVVLPIGTPAASSPLRLFTQPGVRRPFVEATHAVLVEFPISVWMVTFLKEVAGASSGAAATLGAVWGLCMMVSRLLVPRWLRVAGPWARSAGFAVVLLGTMAMWVGPGLAVRVFGIVLVAFGSAPLYPLAVDRLYARAQADSVSLGAVTALASGVAIVTGPLVLGVLADVIGLRHAVLAVAMLAAVGVVSSRPRTAPLGTTPVREPLSVG